jgi:Pyruvate/2-oxoacid:ferredoxin oxidoreductase delta subunit
VATFLTNIKSLDEQMYENRYKIYKERRKQKYGEDWPSMKPVIADNKKKMKCGICRKTSKDGEVFLATNKTSFGWIGFHKRCLVDMAEQTEIEDYRTLRKRIVERGKMF